MAGVATGEGGGGVFARALRAEVESRLQERDLPGRFGTAAVLADEPSEVDLSIDELLRKMGLLDDTEDSGELSEADEYGFEIGHERHSLLPKECYRACLWEREALG